MATAKFLRQLDKQAKSMIGLGSLLFISVLLGQSLPAAARNSKEALLMPEEKSAELSQWPGLTIPRIPVSVPELVPYPEDIMERGIEAILGSFLKEEPPISTSLEDALGEVPFLDDFNPETIAPLTFLPRSPQGGFLLRPGFYKLNAESYCLYAGKYGPGKGDGYLYSPLKGSRAGNIRNILQRSVARPEIPQQDIQVLLWAILSRTKISDLSPNIQAAAGKLLTPEEILSLNGGAWGLISDSKLRQAIDRLNLPPAVQQVLSAETRLRSLLSGGSSSYAELERIAVLFGDAPKGEGSHEVPEGRWSYHPKGYFLRYFPNSYSLTRIEVSVPEFMQIERDQLGRITRLVDRNGNSIETDYDDSIPPLRVTGNPAMKGYAFRSIRFVRPLEISEVVLALEARWDNLGWTLVGISTGEGRMESPASRFTDAAGRYQWAKAHQQQITDLDRHFQPQGNLAEAVNLGNYATSLSQVIQSSPTLKKNWATSQLDLVKQAWQLVICQREGGCQDERAYIAPPQYVAARLPLPLSSLLAGNKPDGSDGNGAEIEGGIATPGNTSQQRIAQSNRPNEEVEKQENEKKDCQYIEKHLNEATLIYRAFASTKLLEMAEKKGLDGHGYNVAVERIFGQAISQKGWEYLDSNTVIDNLLYQVSDDIFNLIPKQSATGSELLHPLGAAMGTNMECQIGAYIKDAAGKEILTTYDDERVIKKYVNRTGSKWAGKIIYDEVVAHEKSHQKTCIEKTRPGTKNWDRSAYSDYLRKPRNYQDEELKAYETSIAILLEALKKCN